MPPAGAVALSAVAVERQADECVLPHHHSTVDQQSGAVPPSSDATSADSRRLKQHSVSLGSSPTSPAAAEGGRPPSPPEPHASEAFSWRSQNRIEVRVPGKVLAGGGASGHVQLPLSWLAVLLPSVPPRSCPAS